MNNEIRKEQSKYVLNNRMPEMKPTDCPDVLTQGESSTVPVTVGWYLQGLVSSLLTHLLFSLLSEINVFVRKPNLKFLAYTSIIFIIWLIIIGFILIKLTQSYYIESIKFLWWPSKAKCISEANLSQRAWFYGWGYGGTESLSNMSSRHTANWWKDVV